MYCPGRDDGSCNERRAFRVPVFNLFNHSGDKSVTVKVEDQVVDCGSFADQISNTA